jgi:hypothetical protein
MDSKLFRLPTQPNLYASIAAAQPFSFTERQKFAETPAPDARYPGWAAPMSDGRLVTTYRNHCSQNVPTGKQYATKEWMTKNATEIMRLHRQRQAHITGAYLGLDSTVVPPPATVVTCSRSDCSRVATQEAGGIGQERGGAEAPDLFGTWDPRESMAWAPPAKTGGTTLYEGGRNTPRGAGMPEMR